MSVLTIVQDAADELSLRRPTSVVGSTDVDARKLLRNLTTTIKRLHARYEWQTLRRVHSFTTVAAAAQTNAVPSDFQRFIPESFFNRTRTWRVTGPLSSSEWQAHLATLETRVYDAFTMLGNVIYAAPQPAAGETWAYEYITRRIGWQSDGTTELTGAFAADTDLPFLDEELLTLGVIWRHRKTDGLDYSEEYREFELMLADLLKRDGGSPVITMGGGSMDFKPMAPRTPDTLVGL